MYPRGRLEEFVLSLSLLSFSLFFILARRLKIRNFLHELTCLLPLVMVTFCPSYASTKLPRRDRCKMFYCNRVPSSYFTSFSGGSRISHTEWNSLFRREIMRQPRIMRYTIVHRELWFTNERLRETRSKENDKQLDETEDILFKALCAKDIHDIIVRLIYDRYMCEIYVHEAR